MILLKKPRSCFERLSTNGKIVNVINAIPIRPELRRRADEGFLAESLIMFVAGWIGSLFT